MAKQLRDIVKKGADKATLVPNDLGGYSPKAGDEKRFVAKHIIQKHPDRNGNDKGVFDSGHVHYDLNFSDEKRHGRKKGEDKEVYEAHEKEDTKCNMSESGTMCEVHGMADCKKAKPLTEKDEVPTPPSRPVPTPPARPKDLDKKDSKKDETQGGQLAKTGMRTFEEVEQINELKPATLDSYKTKAFRDVYDRHNEAKPDARKDKNRQIGRERADDRLSGKMKVKYKTEEVELDEVLTKSTTAGETIHDFVHSDNPKFEGKSKKKRTQMALAAYYAKQREKKN